MDRDRDRLRDRGGRRVDQLNNSDYRREVRQIIPLEVQMAIRAGCSDVRNEAQQITGFMEQCVLDVDDAILSRTANALRANAQVRATLQSEGSLRCAASERSVTAQWKLSCQVTPKRSPTQANSSLKP
jgi:hypothetical protein